MRGTLDRRRGLLEYAQAIIDVDLDGRQGFLDARRG